MNKDSQNKAALQAQRELAQEEKNSGYYLSSRSLFDQISMRYQKSRPQLWNLQWSLPQNRQGNLGGGQGIPENAAHPNQKINTSSR